MDTDVNHLLNTTAVKAPEPEPSRTVVTSTSLALQVGDVVTMPLRLSRWERFLLWLAHPTRWPAKTYRGQMRVTHVASSCSTETEWT